MHETTSATFPPRSDWAAKINRLAYDDADSTTTHLSLPAYAWPGGYPIVYVDGLDESVCPTCANKPDDHGGKIVDYFIHYEGPPEYCVVCNATIESAYGDPDDDTESEDVPS